MKTFDVRLIDCDIHPFATEEFPLAPHIPENFRQAVAQGQAASPGHGYVNPFGVNRRDMPRIHPEVWASEHFDRCDIAYGVLQPPGLSAGLTQNSDVSCVIARVWHRPSRMGEFYLTLEGRVLRCPWHG